MNHDFDLSFTEWCNCFGFFNNDTHIHLANGMLSIFIRWPVIIMSPNGEILSALLFAICTMLLLTPCRHATSSQE
jgi:hypothetical protein